jgi:hypothetical protein
MTSRVAFCSLSALIFLSLAACATIRVTDPAETADQKFLESEATRIAVSHISADQLRDRKVYVDTTYLSESRNYAGSASYREVPQQFLFLVAELRARLLLNGVRLVDNRADADIIVEARSGGVSIDRQDFLLGLANVTVPTEGVASIPFQTPEIAILKSTKQFGYASVAIVAYWRDSGEIVSMSGPFVGRTARQDYWVFGFGPRTVGNIPPALTPAQDSSK